MIALQSVFLALTALCLLVLVALPQETRAEGVVLLSFDTEYDPDASAVQELAIDVPATYFFTGQYALANPDLLEQLAAAGHSIGSHSHGHERLNELTPTHLAKDLRLSKMVLEAISGKDVRWFRAPYLEYDDEVMQTVRDVGLSHDSSDIAEWMRNTTLPELAIAIHDGRLLSDYDMFEQDKLSDREALEWLIDAYETRAETNQPTLILLHPRIIGEHASVLHDFIAHVKVDGGVFHTMDTYSDGLSRRPAAPHLVGLWVDLSFETVDPETLVADARSIGVTDVFLSVIDPSGVNYLWPDPADPERAEVGPILAALRRTGIRVHAWIAVNSNVLLATERPELAMQDATGNPSDQWIAFSMGEARKAILDNARSVLSAHEWDGLHLDYIRYPGLEYGYSAAVRDRFSSDTGLDASDSQKLVSDYYGDWVNWRMREIAGLVAELRGIAKDVAGPDAIVSAALIGDAAVNFRSREKFGQDYALLARQLDLILPMAYYPLDQQDTDWVQRVLYAARWQAGDTQVVAGLASFNQPGDWEIGTTDMVNALNHALTLSDGVTFYPYSGLFNRRDAESGVGEDVLASVHATLADARQWRGFVAVSRLGKDGTLLLTAAALILTMAVLWLALTGRRSWLADVIGDPSGEKAAPQTDWREEDAECDSGRISGATCARISQRLRNVPADLLDAAKVQALLEGNPKAGLVGDTFTAWPGVSKRLLDGAVVTGVVTQDGTDYALSATGQTMLARLFEEGIDRAYCAFLVRRMSETLTAPCQNCGARNRLHYFWVNFECAACGTTNIASTIEWIEVAQASSGAIAGECEILRQGT